MDSGFQRPLRSVVTAGWLALAWTHLFWNGEGIYAAAAEVLPDGMRPDPGVLSGSRIGIAFGAWFLVAGSLAMVWRPAWLARAVLGLGCLPALIGTAARAAGAPQTPLVAGLAESWLWWAPVLLVLPVDRGAGVRTWGARIGLGLVFGAVATSLLATGRFPWEAAEPAGWRGVLPETVPWALVLGLVAVVSWAMLWIRPLAPAGTLGLGCVGLCAALAWVQGEQEAAGDLEHWHRRAPEMVLLLGAAGLPWALRETRPRRQLRRIDGAG